MKAVSLNQRDDHAVGEERAVRPADSPHVLWQKMRRLVSLVEECSYRFDTVEHAFAAQPKLSNDALIYTVCRDEFTALRYRFVTDAQEDKPLTLAEKGPWAEVLRLEGGLSTELCRRTPEAIIDASAEGADALPDEVELAALLSNGQLTLVEQRVNGGWVQHAQLSAPFLTTDEPATIAGLSKLVKDLSFQQKLAADPVGAHDFSGYGSFLKHLTGKTTPPPARPRPMRARKPRTDDLPPMPDDIADRYVQNGELRFTSRQEFGRPVWYRQDAHGWARPLAEFSVLLLHFGQSNAGVHAADGLVPGAIRTPYHAVNLNDEVGVRGWMGTVPEVAATGFEPLNESFGKPAQSIVGVAAGSFLSHYHRGQPPLVICRSEAKGGQALIGQADDPRRPGIYKDGAGRRARAFSNLMKSLSNSIRLARAEGAPVRYVFIAFTHQEADRGVAVDDYVAQARAMFDEVEAVLKPSGLTVHWLLDQASGSDRHSSGGLWRARLAVEALADTADNVHLIQPRYAYPMADSAHWNSRAKVLYGELLGHAIWHISRGERFDAPRLAKVTRDGATVTLDFDASGPLCFDNDHHPVADSVEGFTIAPNRRDTQVISARLTGPKQVTLTLNHDPETLAGQPLNLRYAFRPTSEADVTDGWPVSTGSLRLSDGLPCQCFPEETLYRWVPAFEVEICPAMSKPKT